MNRLLILLCIGCIVFSCKSKKALTEKESKTASEKVETKQNGGVKPASKVYSDNTERYIDTHRETAQKEMILYGIPASITLAQGILESGSGQGRLAMEGNNHFGIKCHDWTGKTIYHDDDKRQECFRKYVDAKYSFRDHSLFLSERDRYSKLFKLHPKDYTGWATGLREAGYATDKLYPQKLIYIIERYRLYKFDEEVLAKDGLKARAIASNSNEVFDEDALAARYAKERADRPKGRGVYIVEKGDTQYSISKKHNMSVKELQSWNELSSTNLEIGQVLIVATSEGAVTKLVNTNNTSANKDRSNIEEGTQVYVPKKNRPEVRDSQNGNSSSAVSRKNVYVVLKGDTQYSISKRYNMSVKELQNLNGLNNTSLSVGQTLIVLPSSVNTGSDLVSPKEKNDAQVYVPKKNKPIAKEDKNTNVSTNTVTGKTYTVVKGDTQYSISKRHNMSVKQLQSLNGLSSTNLNVGQVLKVTSSPVMQSKPTNISSSRSTNGKKAHTVVKGDTQYSISKKYNLTVDALQKMNGLSNTNLSVGQVLVVQP